MKLELQRDLQTAQGTTGRMFVDGAPFCVTLERPAARFGDAHPCIPAGDYRVVLSESPHFGRLMPLLQDVRGRTGIEIHWGNFVSDFQGCIGVGSARSTLPDGKPAIWNSRATFDQLFSQIQAARAEGCTIAIRDPQLLSANSMAARDSQQVSAIDSREAWFGSRQREFPRGPRGASR